jgi:hypothetical protein
MMMSSNFSRCARASTVASVASPAGTIIQMARGGLKVKPTEDELHPRRPKLNPQWVEQLMGLAPGAVSTCKAAPKAARKRSARGSKTIEPAAE